MPGLVAIIGADAAQRSTTRNASPDEPLSTVALSSPAVMVTSCGVGLAAAEDATVPGEAWVAPTAVETADTACAGVVAGCALDVSTTHPAIE